MKISNVTKSVLLLAACGLPSFSKTIVVNSVPFFPSCNGAYQTIQAGVDAAVAGDIVYVCAGTYNEQVTIASKNISLVGQSGAIIMPSNVIVKTSELYPLPPGTPLPAAPIVLVQNASNVTVAGVTVDGTNNGLNGCGTDILGIYYQNAGGTIAHNAIRYIELSPGLLACQVGLGILVESTDNASNSVSVVQNSIHDYQKDGIDFEAPTYKLTAQYNTVRGFGPTGVIAQNGVEIDAASSSSTVLSNNVSANVYICPPESCYTATGVLNFADNVSISSNTVTSSDTAVYYYADKATVSSNNLSGATYDGIYLLDTAMDSGSTITKNTVTDSPYAIEVNGSSANVSITTNTVIEAAVGIANDNGNAITISGNKYFDVPVSTQTGPAAPVGGRAHNAPKPSRSR